MSKMGRSIGDESSAGSVIAAVLIDGRIAPFEATLLPSVCWDAVRICRVFDEEEAIPFCSARQWYAMRCAEQESRGGT